MKAIIVDDEILNIRLLEIFCKKYAPSVDVIATADHADLAIRLIGEHKPDLVFLDIKLYDKNAFDVLKNIQQPDLMVVLVSASEEYGLQAIKARVMDYLLKPVSIDEFKKAVEKCEKELINIKILRNDPTEEGFLSEPGVKYLQSSYKSETLTIAYDNLLHIEAREDCIGITTMDNRKYIASGSMKELEGHLPLKAFLKVHRSHIVNRNGIRKFIRSGTGTIFLINGEIIPVSSRKRKLVEETLNL